MQRFRQVLAVLQQQLCPVLPTTQNAFATQAKAAKQQAQEDRKQKNVHVVLLQDVYGLGRKGDVKSANPGWVRHALFPRGAALYATPENVAKYAKSQGQDSTPQDQDKQVEKEILRMLRILSHQVVNVSRKAVEDASSDSAADASTPPAQPPQPPGGITGSATAAGGSAEDSDSALVMKGSVTPYDVRTAVLRQTGVELHESHLLMTEPITSFGTFKVPLNFRMLDNRQVELQVVVHRVKRLRHGRTSV